MEDEVQYVETARARRLAYVEYGDPDGLPVIYCHGFPSSGHEARLLHPAAVTEHVRVIAPDRPGYGGSDYCPDRTIEDWAQDVTILADRLELEHFSILGISGGGPFALACAWGLAERISGCSLVCPLGPVYLKPILGEMGCAARFNFSLARHAPLFSAMLLGPLTTGFLSRWPQTVDGLRTLNAPAADLAELADPSIRRTLNRTISHAMRDGARGARQELLLYMRDWGIPVEDIDLRVDVWHGEADGTVPVSHARWYAARLRRVQTHYLPNEGHYSLPLRYAGDILRALLARPAFESHRAGQGRH